MGFRFRKSFKIAPGVRVNVGKKSVGISAGVKGARVSVNSSGRKTTTVGLPGTGLSYSKTEKIGGSKTKAAITSASDEPLDTVTRPDLPPSQPQEEKKKNGCCGCLTYLVALAIVLALFNSCGGGDKLDKQGSTADSATTTTTSDAQPEQMITSLTLDGEAPTEINVGDSCTLTYTIAPSDFLIDDSVAYATTSDNNVLSVTAECCVKPARVEVTLTGKAAGTANYTIRAAEGDAQQTGQITVHDRAAEQAAAEAEAKAKAEKEAAEKAAAEKAAQEQAAAEAAAAQQAAQEQTAAQQSETVYVTPSGKRWHRSASCAGKNARAVTMDQVGGRTPCKKCAS